MKWRWVNILSVLALGSLCWLTPERGWSQQASSEKATGAAAHAAREMEVFRPKYVSAEQFANMVQPLLGRWGGGGRGQGMTAGPDVRLSIDERTNSVIIMGTPDVLELAKTLLQRVDVGEGKGRLGMDTKSTVRIYALQHSQADSGLVQALNLLPSLQNHFSVDSSRNVVIVTGDQKTLEAAEMLIQRLDERPEKPLTPEIRIRIVWLASGLKEGSKLPEDMQPVAAELVRMGIEEPRLVTQTVISAVPGRPFRVEGLTGRESPYRLQVSGSLQERASNQPDKLQISIQAVRAAPPGTPPDTVGRLETEISAPLGHSVVLGVTPTATSTSAFVVQLLPRR